MVDYKKADSYPAVVSEKVRLSDTDRQGHVNNVAFGFFLEAGRAEILFERTELLDPGCFFVIVSTTIEFLGELHYPGHVTIATAIERVGNSSFAVRQGLFQDGRCAALSNSVMAQVNIEKRVAQTISPQARKMFESLQLLDQ